MHSPPFHRRILPWIFTLVFIFSAPALIFYTAGYRWNPKKEKIERNGTLIIDTHPADAKVFLNEHDIEETTPVTLQNTTPGSYLIRLTKEGFYSWQKKLDVQPEYVTFANDIWLWKKSEPIFVGNYATSSIEASLNEKYLAIQSASKNGFALDIWDLDNDTHRKSSLETDNPARLDWSLDSRTLFLEEESGLRWRLAMRNGAVPEPSDDREKNFDDYEIRHATGSETLVLFAKGEPNRGLILPAGNWKAVALSGKHLILNDKENWLSLEPDSKNPLVRRAKGDHLQVYEEKKKNVYLLVNGGEIWRWDPANDPELLLRDSNKIVEAVWHASGRDIAFATEKSVIMLNLDPRDGRLSTKLAEFDQIKDLALVKKQIYILGTSAGKTGLWKLEIE